MIMGELTFIKNIVSKSPRLFHHVPLSLFLYDALTETKSLVKMSTRLIVDFVWFCSRSRIIVSYFQ